MRRALESGINWIDTAAIYGLGHSEEVVGRFLRELPPGERPLVFTKCGLAWDERDRDRACGARWNPRPSAPSARRHCTGSASSASTSTSCTGRWRAAPRSRGPGRNAAAGRRGQDPRGRRLQLRHRLLERCEALRHVDSLQPGFWIEGNKSRVQLFQGVVISRSGSGVSETFTVRKVSYGVGVERTFPLHTPIIEKIEVVTRGDVRRAKLYYLRDLRGKKAKIRERRENVKTTEA